MTSVVEVWNASASLPVCGTPGECYYNTLLCCDYFSSSSVLSRAFSALCVYSKFGHHPHPLGYLRAKFRFFRGLHCWANPWRKITSSIYLTKLHVFVVDKILYHSYCILDTGSSSVLIHNLHSWFYESNWLLLSQYKAAQATGVIFTARRSYASTVLGVVILSVCMSVCPSVYHTRALWQNQTIHCGHFIFDTKEQWLCYSDTSEICAQNNRPTSKNADFDRFPLITSKP